MIPPKLWAALTSGMRRFRYASSFEHHKADNNQRELLVRALEAASNGMLIAERSGQIVWVNDAICQMSGYSKEELIGKTPRMFNSGKHTREFYKVLWETILSGNTWKGEITERHRDGNLYTVSQVITPILDEARNTTHFVACHHNVILPNDEELEVRRLAHYDDLTKLPNRRLLFELLDRAIDHASAEHGRLAVMFIDLDRFKQVNDAFGHATGDNLLYAVAERLRSAIRNTDVVERLGGDEFVVLITDLANPRVAADLAQKMIDKICQTFMLNLGKVDIGASVGISLFPEDGESGERLIACADSAMYVAKESGKNCFRFFDETVYPAKVSAPYLE